MSCWTHQYDQRVYTLLREKQSFWQAILKWSSEVTSHKNGLIQREKEEVQSDQPLQNWRNKSGAVQEN